MDDSILVGMFSARSQVEKVLKKLKEKKVRTADVSVIFFEKPHKGLDFQQFDGITEGSDFGGTLGSLVNATSYEFQGASLIVTGPLSERMTSQDQGQKIDTLIRPFLGLGFLKKEAIKIEKLIQHYQIPIVLQSSWSLDSGRIQSLFQACGAVEIFLSSYPSLRSTPSNVSAQNINF